MSDEDIKEEILNLKDGERYENADAEIWLKNKTYFLFEIPQFGGNPSYDSSYGHHRIDEMISKFRSWT